MTKPYVSPQCPPLVSDPRELAGRRFLSTNARVQDPVAELLRERDTAAWSPSERRIFMDKYLAFPKVPPPPPFGPLSSNPTHFSRAQPLGWEQPTGHPAPWTPCEAHQGITSGRVRGFHLGCEDASRDIILECLHCCFRPCCPCFAARPTSLRIDGTL